VHTGFWWEALGNRQPRKPKRRWEPNIKMGLQEVRWGLGVD